jgi:single-strand DNA-binding protein
MAGVNKVILVGNLGKDPEVRHLENGRAVATFSLATSETYKNKNGERVTATEWHNIVMWTPLAEIAEKYLKKGNQILVEGKITTRSYEDKEKVKRYTTEIVAQSFNFIGGPSDGSKTSANTKAEEELESVASNGSTDDLPF